MVSGGVRLTLILGFDLEGGSRSIGELESIGSDMTLRSEVPVGKEGLVGGLGGREERKKLDRSWFYG